jgi:hypothetical protein
MAILPATMGTLKVEAGACWTVYSSLKVSGEGVSQSISHVESGDILSWDLKLVMRVCSDSPSSPKSTALKKCSSGYDEISISIIPLAVRQRSRRSGLNGCAEPIGRSCRSARICALVVVSGSKKTFVTFSMIAEGADIGDGCKVELTKEVVDSQSRKREGARVNGGELYAGNGRCEDASQNPVT